ncbi:hypothetical protein [uncultured Sanguibacteroides sp.]|uniref:HU domain-containing protein n=1 Tax=uncultured Sanguibacteroides sp. TaxID=1635151 RepID=UPI0025EC14F8|nr:hypothetical protein [uncultured Sanguibacteroides sp.]
MYKYIEHIEDLLYLHDCVIVPGFGGFIGNYTEATIHPKTGILTPPSKKVVFNKHLKQNDGLLIHWIARKEKIDYEKAERRLSLFCEELKVRLNQNQKIIFGSIGTFYTDRRFNIVFEPGEQNFLADTIGMHAIEVSPSGKKSIRAEYINTDSGNLVTRLFKYGLSAAMITGIIIISQQDIFKTDHQAETSNLQPTAIQAKTKPVHAPAIISPDCDFVEFDPLSTL